MHELVVARHGGALSLLVRCPLFWAATSTITVAAICVLGVLFGLAATFAATTGIVAAAHRPPIHRRMQRAARVAAWRSRCAERETRLDDAWALADGLHQATQLVEGLQSSDPQMSAHLELEALLDHYVDVALSAKRCERALEMSGRLPEPRCVSVQHGINERLYASRKELQDRSRRLRDELEAIPELLCLVVQRSTLDSTEVSGDPVGDRLALLPDEQGGAIAAVV
jgi:hypothetical protein